MLAISNQNYAGDVAAEVVVSMARLVLGRDEFAIAVETAPHVEDVQRRAATFETRPEQALLE